MQKKCKPNLMFAKVINVIHKHQNHLMVTTKKLTRTNLHHCKSRRVSLINYVTEIEVNFLRMKIYLPIRFFVWEIDVYRAAI